MKNHPKGLLAAALSNMGERFGYYIMNAVLVLFLCSKFGLNEELSGTIYSFFYAGIYILSLVGGIIADRTQNYKGTIKTGLIIMALGYIVLVIIIIGMNIHLLPQVMETIISHAFGWKQALGGGIGIAVMQGIKRGLFSNEAGMGSAPNVAATADVTHPVKQGLIQALGVFTDTLIICTCTAFIILFSGVPLTGETNGVQLTQMALSSEIGNFGSIYVAIAILFFAYSSIIGNYYYGEANVRYITNNKTVMIVFRILSGGMVMFGALASLDLAWSLADISMGLMTICNLIAITLLGKYAFRLLDDYIGQKRKGIKHPIFTKDKMKDIEADIECW